MLRTVVVGARVLHAGALRGVVRAREGQPGLRTRVLHAGALWHRRRTRAQRPGGRQVGGRGARVRRTGMRSGVGRTDVLRVRTGAL